MVPWVERPGLTLDLDGDWDALALPADGMAAGRRLLAAVRGNVAEGKRTLAELADLRTEGRFHAELVALARQAGVDWRDLMLANVSYDLVIASLGCSTLALATPQGPVLARNMDWSPEDLLAQASFALRYQRGGQAAFASAGWPGAVGVVTGLSARGFALALNAVSCAEGVARTGYPMLLFLRTVLEDARDFDEALAMCAEQPLFAPGLITLVGTENRQRVVIERTPSRHGLRRPEGDEPLIATNDYRLLFKPQSRSGMEMYETTCHRFDALCSILGGERARAWGDEELLFTLTDERVIQGITAQHVIMRPGEAVMRLFVPRRLLGDVRA